MKKVLLIISIILILLGIISISLYFYIEPIYQNINDIEVLTHDEENKKVTIKITFNKNYKDVKCGYLNENNKIEYTNITNKECTLNIDEQSLDKLYLKKAFFRKKIDIKNIIINIDTVDKIYLALNDTYEINPIIKAMGDYNISYKVKDEKILSLDKNIIKPKKVGVTTVEIYIDNTKYDEITVDVTSLITKRPKQFNKKKPYLPCNKYSKKEAEKLDEILKTKIENVGGYGTRAAVVEAMRFLLLDFKYRIDYFFENGRLEGGVNYIDGEGRYYHRGLYLDESKFSSIKASLSGPAIWGCPLRNFENYPPKFTEDSYNSNGLDCSGFVSWAVYNGGFDVGDRGAGDNENDDTELNDVGEKVKLTDKLMKSGKVKAGDIIGIWGHIAIIAGIDDNYVYVAESLWTFGGVVINRYDIDKLDEKFVQVTLMDKVYKKDGLYTAMWY